MVQRTLIRPPLGRLGPLKAEERVAMIEGDKDLYRKYKDTIDRVSAYERLTQRETIMGRMEQGLRSFGGLLGGSKR
jgi:hypothetical protein